MNVVLFGRLMAGLLGFLFGLIALLVGAGYVVLWAARDAGWGSAAHMGIRLTIGAFLGAMLCSWLAITVTDRVHARLGWIRCMRCGRRLSSALEICACDPETAAWLVRLAAMQRRRRRHLVVRYRDRLPLVSLGWVALIPVSHVLLKLLGGGREITALDHVAGHIVLCALVAMLGVLLIEVLKMLKLARRFRTRAVIYVRLLALWPCIAAIYMACDKAFS